MPRKIILAISSALAGLALAVGFGFTPRLFAKGPDAAPLHIGGTFRLHDGDSRVVTQASFPGKWKLIYFGYTHCPDACPTALQDIANALDLLSPAEQANVVPVFITIDPARDTPTVMKDYVAAFGPKFVALSGAPDAIGKAETEYRVYAVRHPTDDGDYEMDHSSIIYVMSPQNSLAGIFSHESGPKELADRLKELGA